MNVSNGMNTTIRTRPGACLEACRRQLVSARVVVALFFDRFGAKLIGGTGWYGVLLQTTKSQRHWQPKLSTDRRVRHERCNKVLHRREPQDLVLVWVVWVWAQVDKVQRLRIVLLNQTLEVMTSLLRARQHKN